MTAIPISRAILEELRDFDTVLIANTIGYINPTPSHEFYMGGSIRSVTPSLGPTVGVAVTIPVSPSWPRGPCRCAPSSMRRTWRCAGPTSEHRGETLSPDRRAGKVRLRCAALKTRRA